MVTVVSALGYRGIPLQSPYCGAKHAIQGSLTTPQFGWSRTTSAIVWASQHRHLARTGYESQPTDEPDDDARVDNLLEPVDAETDRGIHGRFDDRASDGDP
jgi:hypothetical protein